MRDDATISVHVSDNTATISTTPGTDTSEVTMTPYRERLNQGVYAGATASKEENGDHACPDCGRTFTSEHGLKIHQTKTHAVDDQPTDPDNAGEPVKVEEGAF